MTPTDHNIAYNATYVTRRGDFFRQMMTYCDQWQHRGGGGADEESSEVGRHQGGSSGEDVNSVGQQHRWLSPKAGEEGLMRSIWEQILTSHW